ncbi:DUF2510 domain-containing protein [Williamsia sp.]|uniref:DUF2510 domain-containing protein n=1 Tax=Williamsia sp. TaxID=1872085 RepID=UPI001A272C94|nr:DUF2510 domain-containing protein [Williamsia sp.]MBJ7287804.1 DUF2510 domain-containing protein [Williamsia sp.]
MPTWIVVVLVIAVIIAIGVIFALVRYYREKPPPIPAGWYPDLHDPSIERRHDGSGWTDDTRPNEEERNR